MPMLIGEHQNPWNGKNCSNVLPMFVRTVSFVIRLRCVFLWVFCVLKMWGLIQNGWFNMENPHLKWMITGGTPISGRHHMSSKCVVFRSDNVCDWLVIAGGDLSGCRSWTDRNRSPQPVGMAGSTGQVSPGQEQIIGLLLTIYDHCGWLLLVIYLNP